MRCLEEHVIGGEIVAAALAIVDGEPPTLAEWVADAGVAASFEPGRTIRVGPRDLISQVAIAGAVEVDVAGDSGAAAELRRRWLCLGARARPPRARRRIVGALVLGGRRATSFRGRRRDRLERTAQPLADAVTAMIQRREHEARAQFGLAARDVTTGIVAARDTEALWDAILGGLRRMLGADRAWIARRSETDPAFIVAAAAHGAPRDAFRIDTTHETSLTVVALASGEPEWVPDIPHSDAAHRGIVSDFQIEAALFLPMADASGAHGLVVLHFDRPRLLRDHERDIAAALAREAGLAFSRLDAERRLRQQATRDPLTGLLNHGAFHGAAADTDRAAGRQEPVALVLCDLDHLKYLNDAYGHGAGDEALRAVAGVLESCARRDDVLGRLGGDEFGWLLPGATPDDAVAAAERALRMAAAVETAAGDGALSLTAGIAVALTAVDGETLFERADGALREGKLGRPRRGPAGRRRPAAPAAAGAGGAASPGAAHDGGGVGARARRAGRRRVVGGVPHLGLRAVADRRRRAADDRLLRRPAAAAGDGGAVRDRRLPRDGRGDRAAPDAPDPLRRSRRRPGRARGHAAQRRAHAPDRPARRRRHGEGPRRAVRLAPAQLLDRRAAAARWPSAGTSPPRSSGCATTSATYTPGSHARAARGRDRPPPARRRI